MALGRLAGRARRVRAGRLPLDALLRLRRVQQPRHRHPDRPDGQDSAAISDQTVSDADEIRNLLGTYCELMDAADWPGVGALFANAALTAENRTVVAAGEAAVRAM